MLHAYIFPNMSFTQALHIDCEDCWLFIALGTNSYVLISVQFRDTMSTADERTAIQPLSIPTFIQKNKGKLLNHRTATSGAKTWIGYTCKNKTCQH
jgi:hypothetical protein